MEKCPGWGGHLAPGLITDLLPVGMPDTPPPRRLKYNQCIHLFSEGEKQVVEEAMPGSCCSILFCGNHKEEQGERSPRRKMPPSLKPLTPTPNPVPVTY